MPPRLTVVVSQSASRDPHLADIEETLAAELMMANGLDATMVGPLEYVQEDDTDFLCISSFNYSFVLLSWLDVVETQTHWTRLGLDGEIVSIDENQPATPQGPRRILHLRMTPQINVATAVVQIKEILNARSVKTISIGLQPAKPAAKTPASSSSNQPTSPPIRPSLSTPAQALPAIESSHQLDDEDDWANLDQLVDDFDSLDL